MARSPEEIKQTMLDKLAFILGHQVDTSPSSTFGTLLQVVADEISDLEYRLSEVPTTQNTSFIRIERELPKKASLIRSAEGPWKSK